MISQTKIIKMFKLLPLLLIDLFIYYINQLVIVVTGILDFKYCGTISTVTKRIVTSYYYTIFFMFLTI